PGDVIADPRRIHNAAGRQIFRYNGPDTRTGAIGYPLNSYLDLDAGAIQPPASSPLLYALECHAPETEDGSYRRSPLFAVNPAAEG
ncbi:MAG: hypothetical protein QF732_09030, partial [Nitrospinaceae bacterium]|nr:hypothetical protein [Nitrospinaceae bacterium]